MKENQYKSTNPITRISIIDDNLTIRSYVAKFIGLHSEFEVVKVFGSIESFLYEKDKNPEFTFDILLLDIGLPGISGIEGIPRIKSLLPEVDIIMLTTYEEEDVILKAICAGACSYLSKKASLEEILKTIKVVDKGGSYMSPSIAREIIQYLSGSQVSKATILTKRQKEIIKSLVDGKTYREIANELFLSPETVKCHIKNMYKVLQVNNKAEAITMYLKGNIR